MFKRSSVRYGRTPAPETPYQKAGQVWDERIGSARVQASNWRLMAFGCLLLSGGLAFGLAGSQPAERLRRGWFRSIGSARPRPWPPLTATISPPIRRSHSTLLALSMIAGECPP